MPRLPPNRRRRLRFACQRLQLRGKSPPVGVSFDVVDGSGHFNRDQPGVPPAGIVRIPFHELRRARRELGNDAGNHRLVLLWSGRTDTRTLFYILNVHPEGIGRLVLRKISGIGSRRARHLRKG